MIDYKAIIERDGCETGCGHSKICMCALAEDMAEEIEMLREALHAIAHFQEGDENLRGWYLEVIKRIASVALGEGK